MRPFQKIDPGQLAAVLAALPTEKNKWAQDRLLAIKLVAEGNHTAAQIARQLRISRPSVFAYLRAFHAGGVAKLLQRGYKGGRRPLLEGELYEQFVADARAGKFRTLGSARDWIFEKTGTQLAPEGARYWMRKAGLAPRWKHRPKPAIVLPPKKPILSAFGTVSRSKI